MVTLSSRNQELFQDKFELDYDHLQRYFKS